MLSASVCLLWANVLESKLMLTVQLIYSTLILLTRFCSSALGTFYISDSHFTIYILHIVLNESFIIEMGNQYKSHSTFDFKFFYHFEVL